MLNNKKLISLAKQYVKKYDLNLEGSNVLVPVTEQGPLLLGLIAGLAKANNIFMYDPALTINKDYIPESEEFNYNIKFVGSIADEILSNVSVILKNAKLPLSKDKIECHTKKGTVVSLFPENLDFLNTELLEQELQDQTKLPIISLNPADKTLGLYQRISHIIIKKCHELGIDVFKSRILLIGNGDFLNCTLGLMKSAGAIVYTYNTTSKSDQSYVLKHLKDIDAIITMDYPQTEKQVIGSKGVISISDIVDQCKLVKIIHISGKIEENSLSLGSINYSPAEITENTLNISLNDLGERGITEIATLSFKAAESFLKLGKKSLNSDKSVVSYRLLNKPTIKF